MKASTQQGRRARPRTRVMAALSVMALVIAACGAGDDTSDADGDAGDEVGDEAGDEEAADADDDAVPYYAENDLELYVATGPGGGAGAIGEFMAPWMSQCIEGEPTVSVTYASSGGGGIAGANDFYNSRNRDQGTRVLQTTLSSVTNFLFGGDEVQYDLANFVAVGGVPVSGVVYASPDTGVETIEDVPNATEQLIMGGNTPPASDVQYILALEALGLLDEIEQVWGYPGTGDHQLAFTQGETNIDGTTTTLWNNSPFLVEDGLANLILALGFPGGGPGGYESDAANPDAPTVPEAYEMLYGEEISGEAWEMFQTIHGQIAAATSWVFHEEAPQAAIDAMTEGIAACTELEEFQEAADEVLGGYELFAGERVSIINDIRQSADPEVIQRARDFLAERYPDEYAG